MIDKNILCYLTLTFRVSPLRGRLYSFCGPWQRCSQRLGMGRLGASHEGPRAAGIGQRRGCRDRVSWRLHPAAGSHLPAEGTAPPFAVAPRSVARGTPRSGDRAAQGSRDRVSWCLHPATGSHLPVEGTAPPFAVAPFRVVAPCPAPQKPHTPPRPTAGFRIIDAPSGFTCSSHAD
jgi:hypothetical protein